MNGITLRRRPGAPGCVWASPWTTPPRRLAVARWYGGRAAAVSDGAGPGSRPRRQHPAPGGGRIPGRAL